MQQKYGAVSVCEMLSHWRGEAKWMLDPDDPLGNLAYRTQLAPGNCQYSPCVDWAANLVDQARKFKADGAIFNNNWGCKTGCGPRPDRQGRTDASVSACRRSRIHCDVIDSTFISRAEIESQMDSFFEMIEGSKAYKERRATA